MGCSDVPATDTGVPLGLVYDMPEDVYHARPELSQSQMKTILDSPARFIAEQGRPGTPRDAFDFGTVVHTMILGVGAYARLDFPDRRTKAYKEACAEARDAGMVPLLASTFDAARAAADKVRAHGIAGPWLTRPGWSEVSMFWVDEQTGVRLRGRVDRLTISPDGRPLLIDCKTTGRSASPSGFSRAVTDHRYDLQEATYRIGYEACTGVTPDFLFVVVESTPTHEVGTYWVDAADVAAARDDYRHAVDTFAACTRTGQWPGYTDTEPGVVRVRRYR